ncbi:ankyrin-3-like [Trichogramma pretiosum]|uniref:ankyrin-3-like n=1 Tax=Trichogramma pretiosum TaxID=7493 RepID=UPI0006C93C7F|nr:ankyrin-3-like [Trichogramma pretiosum]
MSDCNSEPNYDSPYEDEPTSDYESEDMDYCGQTYLEKLKSLRQAVDWDIEAGRYPFFRRLTNLIHKWNGQLPNLREIFRPDEIDWLLIEPTVHRELAVYNRGRLLIDFVISTGYKDEPKVDEDGKPILRRTTAVHCTARHEWRDSIPKLFEIYDKFNVNYEDGEGYTHFHVACEFGCDDVVEKFLEFGQDPNCIPRQPNVDPPLHLALKKYDNKKVVELLLRSGADPNSTDMNGETPLHHMYSDEIAEIFFKIVEENDHRLQPVQVDIRDRYGYTPLHLALYNNRINLAQLLLNKGADPSLTDEEGLTSLHIIVDISNYANRDEAIQLATMLFEVSNDKGKTVQVDAVDKEGRTPLQVALAYDNIKMVEFLLRRGANPNLADTEGLTPLHIICKKFHNEPEELLKTFFEINDELNQLVHVDVRDNSGLTPLQWGVANHWMNVTNLLLDHGAGPSNLVSLTESRFTEYIELLRRKWNFSNMKLVFFILSIVEYHAKKGYELELSEALTIMKIFGEFKLFNESVNIEIYLLTDREFLSKAKKELLIKPNVSFYDLIRMRPEEATKLLTIADFLSFVRSNGEWRFDRYDYEFRIKYRDACKTYLCEIMARGFLQQWILDFFLALTQYRLPILCCEKIIGKLNIEDLWRVCLAAPCKCYAGST